MIRKIVLGASALALSAAGLGLSGSGSAFAGKPTIIAGTGSDIHCEITGSAKLSPALKDDWIKADHSSDPNVNVKNIPNTPYAPSAPGHVSVKAGGPCTGTVTDGTHTASVTKVKVTLVDEAAHPTVEDGSCYNLLFQEDPPPPPSTARYKSTLTYTSPTAKVVSTTVTDAQLDSTFGVSGGTITGSFAGGTSAAQGFPDGTTLGLLADENADGPGSGPKAATSSSPNAPNICQAGLKIKPTSATLKAPKGFKKIGLVNPGSTVDISKP